MEQEKGYNGWANRQTWNCALWIGNDEGLYRAAREFMREYVGFAPYYHFIRRMKMQKDRTADGFKWLSTRVNHKELNVMMRELA